MSRSVCASHLLSASQGVRRSATATGLAALALVLTACATATPSTPEDLVRQRAEERWGALVKQDFQKAYDYMTPSYRAVVSSEQFKSQFGAAGQWTNAIVHAVTCEAESCDVQMRITTKVNVPQMAMRIPEVTTYMTEKWVREEGQWWRYDAI